MEFWEKTLRKTGLSVLILILVALLGLFFALPIKWTWNVTMPYIFGLPTITWGKAWCLNFLFGFLLQQTHTHFENEK